MEQPFLKTGRGGHLRPPDTLRHHRLLQVEQNWPPPTRCSFIFQLTHLLRSRSNFFQNVTGCDKFERENLSAANFMNKIPISRRRQITLHGEERKRERTELVKFRVEEAVGLLFTGLKYFCPLASRNAPSF